MGQHRKDWQVRMKVEDLFAKDAVITDYFTVSLGHRCSSDVLGLTTPTQSQPNFSILVSGDGTAGKVAFGGHVADSSISRSVSSCAISCRMEIWHETGNYWEPYASSATANHVTPSYVASWDASDCSRDLVVPATDGPTYSPASRDADIIYLRYVVWDLNSD